VPDILDELRGYGINAVIHDPVANHAAAKHEYGVTLTPLEEFTNLDGLVLAVSHKRIHGARPRKDQQLRPRRRLHRRRQERPRPDAVAGGAGDQVLELVTGG